ncbi:carboxylesterase/lipase family protein [Streptomyces erythrochromogenes]|uniref:carboxylesterase/lipase family protein n=1 Tax=Streptomyces erythrochromogenes TaxID=285574 RepID=UPI00386F2597|nr:carboxylesterase family protein [Streptomyces erythrochromogenes]
MRGVRRRCALLLPVVLLLVGAAAGPEGPVVDTDRGPVRGRTHGAYSTFEGIPFAAPPTGPRRWRLPEPARRWEGVRDAGAPGSRCVQLPVLGSGGPVGSEDCLYLNVTAPAGPAAGARPLPRPRPRPVMVWFHGGGFFSGSGDAYRPDRLAVRGGAVVVTANYRLGVFGLFGHPELGGAPGFALADQRAALRWVRANAERFGGDPDNVTVFGESAGALSVCAHLTSPASAGLFHKAIVQSGSCSTTTPPSALLPGLGTYEPFVPARRTVEEGALAAARLGCDRPSGVLDCLRALDARTLATPDLMQRFSLVPYGDSALPTEPRQALRDGRFHRVPVLQGTTRDEIRLFLAQTLAAYPMDDESTYRARMERSFGVATARAVEAAYPVSAYPTPAIAWATLLTDASFICPTLRDGAALGRHVPTYGYRFSDRDAPDFTGLPPVAGLPLGAAHGFELPYLFTITPLTQAQQRLADRMAGYWTAFARTGVPAAPGAPQWPPLGASGRVLSLAPGPDGIRPVDGRAEHHCALWDERWPGPGVTTAR